MTRAVAVLLTSASLQSQRDPMTPARAAQPQVVVLMSASLQSERAIR